MTYIIAEVGSNHDGDFERALKLVELARQSGCDAVKFQTYDTDKLCVKNQALLPQAPKTFKNQYERFKSLEFSYYQWDELYAKCQEQEIDFLTTCFDPETLNLWAPRLKHIKIASGDLTYVDLMGTALASGKPILLSTGMASYQEIYEYTAGINKDILTVMHCVSNYPTEDYQANLGAIRELQKVFPHVGYSDHTRGTLACLVAAGMGCEVIEKHFTDKFRNFGDHPISANPDQMSMMVYEIIRIKEMSGSLKPDPSEDRSRLRRGWYAAKPIHKGDWITQKDCKFLRPAGGVQVPCKARKDYLEGDLID